MILTCIFVLLMTIGFGCAMPAQHQHEHHTSTIQPPKTKATPPTRLGLDPKAAERHKAIMREHLEAIHLIIKALSQEDFDQAAEITVTQLGFEKHQEAMQQQNPAYFPPEYHTLAMSHHQVAEDLSRVIPSRDYKQILTKLDLTLKACVDCHRAFRL